MFMFKPLRRAPARPGFGRRALRLVLRCLQILVIGLAAMGPGAPPPPPPPLPRTEERAQIGDDDDEP
jgi:hypothetical protein